MSDETASTLGRPCRVAVWGTGLLGGAVIRETWRLPSLDLVGVLSYSPKKVGCDAGEVVGIEPTGIEVVADAADLVATAPDVVIYVPMDVVATNVDDMVTLLEAGLDVITALPYRRLEARDDDVHERLRDAALAGKATFAVAGVNPDFVWERLAATVTGLCTHIDRIRVQEVFRMDTVSDMVFDMAGFGQPIVENPVMDEILLGFAARYFVPEMELMADHLGVELERIESKVVRTPAPATQSIPNRSIAAGTQGQVLLGWDGYVDGRPFLTFMASYYGGDGMRPSGSDADEFWRIEIEGRPSVRLVIETLASLDGSTRYPDDPTPPGYYAIAGPVIQHIPHVVTAPPGIFESVPPRIRYRPETAPRLV